MKITRNIIIVFVQMLILNACAAHEKISGIKVTIDEVSKHTSFIKVVFANELDVDYWLSVYNFCQSGVMFQDLFIVKNIESKDLYASYAGPVDFVSEGSKTKDQFLKIEPNAKVSCEVDMSQYYVVKNTGTYSVQYRRDNPGFEHQHSAPLASNEIIIKLSAEKNSDH